MSTDSRGPKEVVYDGQLSDLVNQVIAICKRERISMIAQFELDLVQGEGPLCCRTVLPGDGFLDENNKRAAALISRWHSGLFRFRGLVHPPAFDDGGAVMNQGIHAIDLLPSFLGEPERVSATH